MAKSNAATRTQTSPWLTVNEAAEYARRHHQTIHTALRDGSLKGYQRGKQSVWTIHINDLDEWIRGGDAAAAS